MDPLPARQEIAHFGELDGRLGVFVLAAVVLDAVAAGVTGVAQHGQAVCERILGDLPGDMGVHGPGRHLRVAGVAAEVKQHAEAGVIYRFADADHVIGNDFGAPVVLGADAVAVVEGALRVFLVAGHDEVHLFIGEGFALAAGVNAEGARAEDFGDVHVAERVLIVLITLPGVSLPRCVGRLRRG